MSGRPGIAGGSAAPRHRRRIGRLLLKRQDAVGGIDMHDPKTAGLAARNLETADGDVGALLDMLLQHGFEIHFVNVIAGQDDDITRIVTFDNVDILEDGIGGAEVPFVVGDALARRQDIETFIALRPEEVPAALQMANQAVRLVLRCHRHAANAGVQRVGQREVDNTQLAAEIDCRFGAPVGLGR
jgi:hypothetical protein